MKTVVQEDASGCAIASIAALTNQTYGRVKREAAQLGIAVNDSKLWSETAHVRRLLAHFGMSAGVKEERFVSWGLVPDRALLAIKWHMEKGGPAWHWVLFVRDESGAQVLDPKRGLRKNRRTDFGRMKPKWFIRLGATKRARRRN